MGVIGEVQSEAAGAESQSQRLRELAGVFLKLGLICFGGPAAHVGLMEQEFVRRKKWLTHEHFADLMAAANLIPGPNSTEMAIYVGQSRAGFSGLVVAGTCFILPAMLSVMAIAWAYQRFGTIPQVGGLLYGVKPVIIAVIAQALWGLAGKTLLRREDSDRCKLKVECCRLGIRGGQPATFNLQPATALPDRLLWLRHRRSAFFVSLRSNKVFLRLRIGQLVLGLSALALGFLGVNELLLLLGAGLAALAAALLQRKTAATDATKIVPTLLPFAALSAPKAALAVAAPGVVTGTAASFGLLPLFLFFLKVGAVLYGSGYVLLAFLRSDLVERWHWLSEAQLLDAVAVGQITPGPLFTTATFVGYVLGGVPAALLATLGIFLPAFVFVAISGPIIPRLRRSALAGAFLDGVVVASLALMAVVTWHLGRAALCDVPTVALALASLALLIVWRVNSVWLVLGGAALGLTASWLGWVR